MIYKLMLWNALKNSHYGYPSIFHGFSNNEIQVSLGDKVYFKMVDSQTYQLKQTVLGADEEKILVLV